MRIISGKAKGLRLKSLKGQDTRPTADRIKGSLFNIISAKLEGAKILDLFSGTGALGIESLSRGAEFAVLNDINKESIKIIKENLVHTNFTGKAKVTNKEYKKILFELANEKAVFDIIFLDPPYGNGLEIEALKIISEKNILKENGIVVIENESVKILEETIYNMIKYDKRDYGRTSLNFYKRSK